MSATAMILTCERDMALAEMCAEGVRRFWPGVTPMLVVDTDRSTETPLPVDIREMARRIPYIRRIFDFPAISPTEDIYQIDSDCFIYSEPTDFGIGMYQGVPGHDTIGGLKTWQRIGYEFPIYRPRFCSGIISYRKSDFLRMRDLAIKYLRAARLMRCDVAGDFAGVLCEQSLAAGMHRMLYKNAPLPYERYPINIPTDEQVIFHVSDAKWGDALDGHVADYRRHLDGTATPDS